MSRILEEGESYKTLPTSKKKSLVKSLLRELAKETDQTRKVYLRRKLRKLGHRGGLREVAKLAFLGKGKEKPSSMDPSSLPPPMEEETLPILPSIGGEETTIEPS